MLGLLILRMIISECFLGCYEKRLWTDPSPVIGLLQCLAANKASLGACVNLFLSLSPSINIHAHPHVDTFILP